MSKLWIMYYKSSKAREVSPEELAMVFCFGFLFGFFKEPDPLAIHSDLGYVSMSCMVAGSGKTLKK